MATAAKAFGSLLNRETSPGGGTFTTIGGMENLNFPEIQTDMEETTDMEAASAYRTRVPTLNNLGDCTFDLFFDSADATQEQLQADQVAQTVRLYQIVATDTGAADWQFNAYVTRFAVQAQRDGVVKAAVTLSPTGAVTRA